MESRNNRYLKVINGITFIDAVALEASITKETLLKDHLRQKMINVGVEFWDEEKTIVKKPVVGISSIGGFSICIENDLPPGTIKLWLGETTTGPIAIESLAQGFRQTNGMQSTHTFMNPNCKTPNELYTATTKYGHYSINHGSSLSFHVFGMSQKVENEFDVQRDVVYLARETSARSGCQNEPALVALTETGARVSKKIREDIIKTLAEFPQEGNKLDWLEERNGLFPKNAAVSLGVTGTVRNLMKLIADLDSDGKELEYRNLLAIMNDSLNNLFPELFKANKSSFTLFAAKPKDIITKRAILLLGAPGVGKSTQTERLLKQLEGVMCVSTGNLVRKLNKKVEANLQLTEVEKLAAKSLDLMKQGKLMDDKPVYDLLMAHLSPGGEGYQEYCKSHTIILDGVIKAERNIKPFEAALDDFNKHGMPMSLQQVINISASEEELIQRQKTRVQQALNAGLPQRPDDNVDVYRDRLKNYLSTTEAVIKYYQTNNYHYSDIDSSRGIDNTTEALANVINTDMTKSYKAAI